MGKHQREKVAVKVVASGNARVAANDFIERCDQSLHVKHAYTNSTVNFHQPPTPVGSELVPCPKCRLPLWMYATECRNCSYSEAVERAVNSARIAEEHAVLGRIALLALFMAAVVGYPLGRVFDLQGLTLYQYSSFVGTVLAMLLVGAWGIYRMTTVDD